MLDVKPDLSFKDQQVGKVASKTKDFKDYAKKAFNKVGLPMQVSRIKYKGYLTLMLYGYTLFIALFVDDWCGNWGRFS